MEVMVPAQVAEVAVIALAASVVTLDAVLTPLPLAATLMAAAIPPPLIDMLPVYDCTAVGWNFTKTA